MNGEAKENGIIDGLISINLVGCLNCFSVALIYCEATVIVLARARKWLMDVCTPFQSTKKEKLEWAIHRHSSSLNGFVPGGNHQHDPSVSIVGIDCFGRGELWSLTFRFIALWSVDGYSCPLQKREWMRDVTKAHASYLRPYVIQSNQFHPPSSVAKRRCKMMMLDWRFRKTTTGSQARLSLASSFTRAWFKTIHMTRCVQFLLAEHRKLQQWFPRGAVFKLPLAPLQARASRTLSRSQLQIKFATSMHSFTTTFTLFAPLQL